MIGFGAVSRRSPGTQRCVGCADIRATARKKSASVSDDERSNTRII